jgi:hypothetical protein
MKDSPLQTQSPPDSRAMSFPATPSPMCRQSRLRRCLPREYLRISRATTPSVPPPLANQPHENIFKFPYTPSSQFVNLPISLIKGARDERHPRRATSQLPPLPRHPSLPAIPPHPIAYYQTNPNTPTTTPKTAFHSPNANATECDRMRHFHHRPFQPPPPAFMFHAPPLPPHIPADRGFTNRLSCPGMIRSAIS